MILFFNDLPLSEDPPLDVKAVDTSNRLAIVHANLSQLQVGISDEPHFDTLSISDGNAMPEKPTRIELRTITITTSPATWVKSLLFEIERRHLKGFMVSWSLGIMAGQWKSSFSAGCLSRYWVRENWFETNNIQSLDTCIFQMLLNLQGCTHHSS